MMNLQFAQNFAARRRELGYTQEQIANYIGVSRAAVSKWEKGQSYPDITILPKLATYFNWTIDQLLGYKPQLTNEKIIELYKELAIRLHKEPFSDVELTIEALIEEYYACFPFLLKMAQLYLNYAQSAQDPQQIAVRIETLCERVQQFSEDFALVNEARIIGAVSLLMQQRPDELLDKIGHSVQIQLGEDQLISQAYGLLGQPKKAQEILQASLYQYLLSTVSTCTSSLLLLVTDTRKFDQTIERAEALITNWQLDVLHPNSALSFYTLAATGYMQMQQTENAMTMLKRYVKVCEKLTFPLQLRGDDYFSLIDDWLATTMQLATVTPRDTASIKHDLITTITQSPSFTPLHKNKDFQLLVTNLQHLIERNDS
ncbi:MAG: helix-turn-helix domain-containing protein [Solibacillus sp.]